jgi:prolyl-tRNA editing enzyme YbaK/EbsC (Cys-tRNA(Pro) deacylase)
MSDVMDYLIGRGLSFLVLPDPSSVTADEAARAHRMEIDELVRTEVVLGKNGPCLLVVPATRYLDLALAQRALGDPTARPATHAEIRAFAPGCDIGAVPPLSLWLRAPMYVDPVVADREQLVFPAARANVLVCVQREELFRDDPYVVVALTRESFVPDPAIAPSRRSLLSDAELLPVHLAQQEDAPARNENEDEDEEGGDPAPHPRGADVA